MFYGDNNNVSFSAHELPCLIVSFDKLASCRLFRHSRKEGFKRKADILREKLLKYFPELNDMSINSWEEYLETAEKDEKYKGVIEYISI